jgi:hypothetical protein
MFDPPPFALTKQTDNFFVDILPVTFDRCLDARDSSKKKRASKDNGQRAREARNCKPPTHR